MRFLPCLILLIFTLPNGSAQSECLIFGKGGGLSGSVTQYMIQSNGKVYKGSGMVDILYSQKGKISKPDAKKIYADLKSIPDTSFHHPGNVYYFIQLPGDTPDKRYTWGDPDFKVPDALGKLYQSAMDKVAGLKYKTVKKPLK
jgi:hypothetical protein